MGETKFHGRTVGPYGSLVLGPWPEPGLVESNEFDLFVKALQSYHDARKHMEAFEVCDREQCIRRTSRNFEAFRSKMTGYHSRDPHHGHGASGECECRNGDRQSCAASGCPACRKR